jgi:REP-associated tyrosine transposase
MARPLRIEFEGAVYHVTSRGDGGEDIYLDDEDRDAWLEALGFACERMAWACYAYCLMSNHYHIVVETPQPNLSRGMRQLNGVYTQRFNRRHGRAGHVFQGRYKAILVDKESYLLEAIRYVVMNPVRARLVEEVAEWPWSSYAPTAGLSVGPSWLATDGLLSHFATTQGRARKRFREFVGEGALQGSLWEALRGQVFLGGDAFVKRMRSRLSDGRNLSEVPRRQHRPAPQTLRWYGKRYRDRDEAMARAYLSGDYTLKAIAEHFGLHYGTVSRAVKRFEQGHR